MPMILAAGAVHSHLVRQGAAHLQLAQRALGRVPRRALLRGADRRRRHGGQRLPRRGRHRRPPCARPVRRPRSSECLARYKEAVDQGLLKVMSKMGISVISSYRGGYNFEAVGLSRSLAANTSRACSPASPASASPASRSRSLALHGRALRRGEPPLPIGGFYRYRRGGETPRLRGAGSSTSCSTRSTTDSLPRLQALRRGGAAPARRSRSARPARLQPQAARRSRSRRSRASPRSGSAS